MTEGTDAMSMFVEENHIHEYIKTLPYEKQGDIEYALYDMRQEILKHRECAMCNNSVGESSGSLCPHCAAWVKDTEAWIFNKSVTVRFLDTGKETCMSGKALKELFPKVAKPKAIKVAKPAKAVRRARPMGIDPIMSSLCPWKPIASTGAPLCLSA